MTLEVHDIASAPEAARPVLESVQKKYGFLPNLYRVFAAVPAALESYLAVSDQFARTSLTDAEKNVVLLAASRENGCNYCVAVHSTVAGMQGVPDHVVRSTRDDKPIDDARLEGLRTLTRAIVVKRGWLDPEDVKAFVAAGFREEQILEVLVGVTLKTLSNYTNHVAQTPLDDAFKAQAWSSGA